MRFSQYILAAFAVLTLHVAAEGSIHYAVSVGVNEYDTSFASEKDWLDGCVADACRIWTNITERGEWTSANSKLFLDAGATKAEIRRAITNIAAIAQSGDVFLYTHSSHGGSFNSNYDVFLCTYDDYYHDWELAEDLAKFRNGVKVVIMVDACNSGGLFKSKAATKSISNDNDTTSSGSFNLAGRVGSKIDAIRSKESLRRGLKAKGISSSEIGWLTAADYDQYSWDGASGGKFTSAALYGWNSGYCDDSHCGNENNYADFYELWNYAKDIATGTAWNQTQAQCENPDVLKSVSAGWVGDTPPPGVADPPRFRPIENYEINIGETISFYIRAYSHESAPATISMTQGNSSAIFENGMFSFAPQFVDDCEFTFKAENANGSTTETFTVSVYPAQPEAPSILQAGSDTLVLGWPHSAGADGYYIYIIEDKQGNEVVYDNIGYVTEYTATGLQPASTYYICICAYNYNNNGKASDWSGWTIAKTAKEDEMPAWMSIPEQSAQEGRPFRFDLARYISSIPIPKLEIIQGAASLDGTVLGFTPADCGLYEFTVSASNKIGVAVAEFSVRAEPLSPKKFALCVGINKYKNISSLKGCVNDSKYLAANLVERGSWNENDVVVLTDSQATKSAIRKAISNFAAMAMLGDTFIYQQSSHGGQTNDTGYEEPLTGEDGKDTFLCVYDEDYYDNTTAYHDYELAEDLAAFKSGVKAAVIVDACFSGGLFKSRDAAVSTAKSFNLPERVSSIMKSNQTLRRARGENSSGMISAEEIGWAVAAEYYEYSYDGGFYHTDEWLEDCLYGEEYYSYGSYRYPSYFRNGGIFLTSATWGWWSGGADTDNTAGNNNGMCDIYEFWKQGYDFCSHIGEFWYDDSSWNYYPQCANIPVLRSIELGWTSSPETLPVLPANASQERISSLLASAADKNLVAHITDSGKYNVFRNWAQGVKPPSSAKSTAMQNVFDSTQAWISFALGADALIADSLDNGKVHIVSFSQNKTSGQYLIEVGIDGVSIGSSTAVPEEMLLANLAEVINAEGATKPSPANFKSTSVNASMETPVDGRVRINLAPKETSGNSYFFRIKIND